MIDEIATDCACPVTRDARECYQRRYAHVIPEDEIENHDEQCDCSCHELDDYLESWEIEP